MDAENKLNSVNKNKYRIRLNHVILTDHGVFYPQVLFHDLVFELTLAKANQVVKGSDTSKLVCKLIQPTLTLHPARIRDDPQQSTG